MRNTRMKNKHTDLRKSHSSQFLTQFITIKLSKEEYFDLLLAITGAECRARERRFNEISISGTKDVDRFVKLYEKISRYYLYE